MNREGGSFLPQRLAHEPEDAHDLVLVAPGDLSLPEEFQDVGLALSDGIFWKAGRASAF